MNESIIMLFKAKQVNGQTNILEKTLKKAMNFATNSKKHQKLLYFDEKEQIQEI